MPTARRVLETKILREARIFFANPKLRPSDLLAWSNRADACLAREHEVVVQLPCLMFVVVNKKSDKRVS